MHDTATLLFFLFAGILGWTVWTTVEEMAHARFERDVCRKCAYCNAERQRLAAIGKQMNEDWLDRHNRCRKCSFYLFLDATDGWVCHNKRCDLFGQPTKPPRT